MRKLILCAALAATITPHASHAQMTLDMTRVTCADVAALPPDRADVFAAFMSGGFNQRFGYVTVGMNDYERNVASVRQWCTMNPQRTIMAALEQSPPQPGPGGAQVKIDMSLITCKQYLAGDAKAQQMIAYWMSGYFRASKNQPVFNFQRFADNKRKVGSYCKKNGGESLMSAIQKNAR
jgi:HdeA/HdeB family